jgi:hypothetical protein
VHIQLLYIIDSSPVCCEVSLIGLCPDISKECALIVRVREMVVEIFFEMSGTTRAQCQIPEDLKRQQQHRDALMYFPPFKCHHMSLMDFVVSPPGCGRSVTNFCGWDAHEAQFTLCPYKVDGDI